MAGIALILVSFLGYPAYPLVPFLPLTERAKVALTVAISILSWIVFFSGMYLAGRVGYRWLRRRLAP